LKREFSFAELLDESDVHDMVTVKFVLRYASKRQLKDLDHLYVDSVAQVHDYQSRFPQEHQIYLIWHPDEHGHGHPELFKKIRQEFLGNILVASPFTAQEVADHIIDPPVVPAPVSYNLWEKRETLDPKAVRKDVLLLWKNNIQGQVGADIIEELRKLRPQTTVTVWCWGLGTQAGSKRSLPNAELVENLSESELCDLYLDHSLLLFTSTFEGFGMPPIEALACGCIPVLHPDVGAAALYVVDGENSLFMNGDLAALAKRLASVLESPEQLESMRQAGPRSILEFDPNTYGPRVLKAAGVE
jgi:glycosyltransferase involved in cell wall biosynthesis